MSLVRIQHRPLGENSVLQEKREEKEEAGTLSYHSDD
jgi:hypothetical protein